MLSQNPLGRAGLTECFAVCWGALFSAAGDLQVGLWVALQKKQRKQAPDQASPVLCCCSAHLYPSLCFQSGSACWLGLERGFLVKDAFSCSWVLLAHLPARGILHLPLPLGKKSNN